MKFSPISPHHIVDRKSIYNPVLQKFPDYGKPDRTTMEMGIVSYYDIGNSRPKYTVSTPCGSANAAGFAGNAANTDTAVFAAVLTRKLMIDIIRMTL